MRASTARALAVLAVLAFLIPSPGAGAIPGHGSGDPVDGPPGDDDQHGPSSGHLPASAKDVELLGKVALTGVPGGIADVAAFGDHAYLAAFGPECAGRPGATGAGVHVVDISTPTAPVKVGFLPAGTNSYVGEGVHVISIAGRQLLLHNNETCDASRPAVSGFSVWDVTSPAAPVKLGQFGDTTPAVSLQTFHTTHSVQGFTWRGKAYAVAQDNQDLKDVDIFDLSPVLAGTGPATLVSEVGLEDWPGAQGSYANGDTVFNHDIQQKVVGGRNLLLVSYWDAGQVLLNIDDPANPVFVTDSDFSSPDPETGLLVPEGNSHQSYWDQDGDYVLSTDEDFSPTRTLFRLTSGPHAGVYGAGEFGWTVPIATAYPAGLTGTTVFGGSGCPSDENGNGVSDRAEVPPAVPGGPDVVVFSRGVCFFSLKVETGQLAGYKAVVVGQSHGGTRNGLLRDGFICGGRGHAFTPTVPAICTGHRAMHLLFDDPPAYALPEGFVAGGDLPPIGTVGATVSAQTAFDGWGYVHLHDGATLAELDTYAIPEALDPAKATGFGDLTVHEVKTDPRRATDLAYFSWYSGGLRVASFGPEGIEEVGHYIAEGGNNFWGVFPHCTGQCSLNDRDLGRGRDNAKRPLILMSDRDSGLWIFRYTGKE